jgi:hypothetical protein
LLKGQIRPSNVQRLPTTFEVLAEQWRVETAALSSVTEITNHHAYLEIIKMGKRALPLILREMETRPDHWFHALSEITGQDPADEGADFMDATNAWLAWGRAAGYIGT